MCCDKPGKYSIILAVGPEGHDSLEIPRLYIPNQAVREEMEKQGGFQVAGEKWFCHPCMRIVEDNLRATILYLQAENGLLAIKPV
jgi:hypothetical protein